MATLTKIPHGEGYAILHGGFTKGLREEISGL